MNSFTAPFFQSYENKSQPYASSERLSSSIACSSVSTEIHFSNKEAFPVKLMHILQLIDTKEPELACIISWQPNGTTFRIHDKKLFEKLVREHGFFNQKSYSSFRRQLNLWGFKKIGKRSKAELGVYGHPLFLRENPRLCYAIARSGGSSKTDKEIKVLMEQENASKIINFSSFTPNPGTQDEGKFDVTAVTDSTKSIVADNQSSMNQQEKYQFYGNLRRPRQTYLFQPFEDKVSSNNAHYTFTNNYENDSNMLEELEYCDSEDHTSYEYKSQPSKSSRHSSQDLFHSQVVEDFDEDALMEIEPLQLDEEITPLPLNMDIGKYLSEALEN